MVAGNGDFQFCFQHKLAEMKANFDGIKEDGWCFLCQQRR
jgi:hypothetical protein